MPGSVEKGEKSTDGFLHIPINFKCKSLWYEETETVFFSKYTKILQNIIKDNSIHKIFIMDIELENNTSGIQIAKYIRENDWDSEIIFTTSHDKMFETVYRNIYQVFDFIEKYKAINIETIASKFAKAVGG